jgi:hypothetical protein
MSHVSNKLLSEALFVFESVRDCLDKDEEGVRFSLPGLVLHRNDPDTRNMSLLLRYFINAEKVI